MPTRRRRIAVVLDPELADALRAAGERLPATSEARRLRALALAGAQALAIDTGGPNRARQHLDELGATRETGDLLGASRRLRHPADPRRESAADTLAWVRGPR